MTEADFWFNFFDNFTNDSAYKITFKISDIVKLVYFDNFN